VGLTPFQPVTTVTERSPYTGKVTVSHLDATAFKPTSRTSTTFVPRDFAELYEHYYLYVAKLVLRFGVPAGEVEDVTQSILLTFFEKNALEDFDPERMNDYQGKLRKAIFGTFLSGFVASYVRHYRDRIQVRVRRESLSVDTPVWTEEGETQTLHDLLVDPVEEDYDDLMEADLLASVRTHLSRVAPPRRSHAKLNLSLLFELILDQLSEHGAVDAKELAELFGVSGTSVQNWLKQLRAEIQTVIEDRQ